MSTPIVDGAKAPSTWVCFAVREEAKHFQAKPHQKVIITGMGRMNASTAVEKAYKQGPPPQLVVTCGFAGGLNPKIESSAIVFDADHSSGLEEKLIKAGGQSARFFCATRVAITAEEKHRLWLNTGMDAVEMESEAVRDFCIDMAIPSATIRVISDNAHEDLPLDFNVLMNAEKRLNYGRLGLTLIRSPRLIIELMAFQGRTVTAAEALGKCLMAALP